MSDRCTCGSILAPLDFLGYGCLANAITGEHFSDLERRDDCGCRWVRTHPAGIKLAGVILRGDILADPCSAHENAPPATPGRSGGR